MNLLAKSCFAPGLISMMSNLIASAGDIDSDGLPEWFKEYSEGMGHEIYRRQISEEDFQNDIIFKKLAEVAYQEEQAIVFALEIQSKQNVNKSIIRLNPINFLFKDWHLFNFFIYIICEDPEVADNIQTLEMAEEKYERIFGRPKKPIVVKKQPGYEQNGDPNKKKPTTGDMNSIDKTQDESKNKVNLSSKVDDSQISSIQKKAKIPKKKVIGVEDFSNQTQNNIASEEEQLSMMYSMLTKAQTQMEVSEEHSLSRLQNHIVVCGIHSSIMHFILPLRAQYLKSAQQDIVIITPL